MTVTQITTILQGSAFFTSLDERGDMAEERKVEVQARSLTPLVLMELYEQLHAKRNEVRRQAGLLEIATPDAGLLVLAFLRHVEEEGAVSMGDLLRCFDEVAQTIQMNRLEELTAERMVNAVEAEDPNEVAA